MKTTTRKKIPECAQWVLTLGEERSTVVVRTEWPFPVSFKPNGETHINNASATRMRKPSLDIEPALF